MSFKKYLNRLEKKAEQALSIVPQELCYSVEPKEYKEYSLSKVSSGINNSISINLDLSPLALEMLDKVANELSDITLRTIKFPIEDNHYKEIVKLAGLECKGDEVEVMNHLYQGIMYKMANKVELSHSEMVLLEKIGGPMIEGIKAFGKDKLERLSEIGKILRGGMESAGEGMVSAKDRLGNLLGRVETPNTPMQEALGLSSTIPSGYTSNPEILNLIKSKLQQGGKMPITPKPMAPPTVAQDIAQDVAPVAGDITEEAARNYLPWILGGVGATGLVGGGAYLATRPGSNNLQEPEYDQLPELGWNS